MQKVFKLFIFFLFFPGKELISQQFTEGIYVSAQEFTMHKPFYAKEQGRKYELKLHFLFKTSTIKLVTEDTSFLLKKDSLFCFCDANGCSRFYTNLMYEILNPGEQILIYRKTRLGGYKNTQNTSEYFFSVTYDSPVYPLTRWNLKRAWPANSAFLELLDIYFIADEDLLIYDTYRKTYRLNHVLKLSQHMNTLTQKQL